MLEEADIICPYCGESITVVIDCSAGDQRYVEDCFVCCQPIALAVGIGAEGEIASIEAIPENS